MCLLLLSSRFYFSTISSAFQMYYFYNSIDFFDKMCYNTYIGGLI
nr:MAG TPA: hypothetical protein [Caudoviricetes sp.]